MSHSRHSGCKGIISCFLVSTISITWGDTFGFQDSSVRSAFVVEEFVLAVLRSSPFFARVPFWSPRSRTMAYLGNCSVRIQRLVHEHIPWAGREDFLESDCPARTVDFMELYCGKGRLVAMVSKVGFCFGNIFHLAFCRFLPSSLTPDLFHGVLRDMGFH